LFVQRITERAETITTSENSLRELMRNLALLKGQTLDSEDVQLVTTTTAENAPWHHSDRNSGEKRHCLTCCMPYLKSCNDIQVATSDKCNPCMRAEVGSVRGYAKSKSIISTRDEATDKSPASDRVELHIKDRWGRRGW